MGLGFAVSTFLGSKPSGRHVPGGAHKAGSRVRLGLVPALIRLKSALTKTKRMLRSSLDTIRGMSSE